MVKDIKLCIKDVIKRYECLRADYLVSLDILVTSDSFSERILKVIISNYILLRESLPDKLLVLVVHFYPSRYLVKALEFYVLKCEVPVLAYGEIVPPLVRRTGLRFRSLVGVVLIKRMLE